MSKNEKAKVTKLEKEEAEEVEHVSQDKGKAKQTYSESDDNTMVFEPGAESSVTAVDEGAESGVIKVVDEPGGVLLDD